jgi:hypothetical protein
VSGRELLKMRHPTANKARTFLAGCDPVETWDAEQALRFNLPFQQITPLQDLSRRNGKPGQ